MSMAKINVATRTSTHTHTIVKASHMNIIFMVLSPACSQPSSIGVCISFIVYHQPWPDPGPTTDAYHLLTLHPPNIIQQENRSCMYNRNLTHCFPYSILSSHQFNLTELSYWRAIIMIFGDPRSREQPLVTIDTDENCFDTHLHLDLHPRRIVWGQ